MLVCNRLKEMRKDFKEFVETDGVVLAICGGYQLLGNFYETKDGRIDGLGLVDLYTVQKKGRLIRNIVIQSDLFERPIVGFENHGGRTYINKNKPLGKVVYGKGNDGKSGYKGVVYKNVIGTQLSWPRPAEKSRSVRLYSEKSTGEKIRKCGASAPGRYSGT